MSNDDVIDTGLLLLLAVLWWQKPKAEFTYRVDYTNPETGEVLPIPVPPPNGSYSNGTNSHGDTGHGGGGFDEEWYDTYPGEPAYKWE